MTGFARSPRFAVSAAFVVNGALYGTWAARVPALASHASATSGQLGLALAGPAVAMIATAPLAARACASLGARTVLRVALACACLWLPVLGLAGSPLLLGLSLAVLGALMGAVDVAMNVAAVSVVRQLGRPLMPGFHAGYSFGGLGGSLGAAAAAGLGIPPSPHFAVISASGLLTVLVVGQALPGARPEPHRRAARGSYAEVVRRPELWLIAMIALCAAVAEGTSAEWSALFLVGERGLSEAAAASAYSAFSITMALTRLVGERLERRFGPHRVLTVSALVAAAGLLATATVPVAAVSYLGFAAAGAGLAFCFPIAMELAGASGRRADGSGGERELGFVTTIAYAGFLAGPPLVGGIAALSSLTIALGVVGVLALAIVPASRKSS